MTRFRLRCCCAMALVMLSGSGLALAQQAPTTATGRSLDKVEQLNQHYQATQWLIQQQQLDNQLAKLKLEQASLEHQLKQLKAPPNMVKNQSEKPASDWISSIQFADFRVRVFSASHGFHWVRSSNKNR